jgi:hypothetical protein
MKTIDDKIRDVINNTKPEFGVIHGNRRFRKGRTGTRIIFFNSYKNGALLACEGGLEESHTLLMEFDESITKYFLQPFQIDFDGFSYTPDALVIHTDLTVSLREVKPSCKAILPKITAQHQHIRVACQNHGLPFSIYTEKESQEEPYLYNRTFLYRSVRTKISTYDLDIAFQKLISEKDSIQTVFDARQCVSDLNLHPLVIDRMLFDGVLKFDEKKKLHPNSKVTLS